MSTDLTAAIEAATPAVLAEMDWPDDREFSAHVEPDGYELTPPGAYWQTAIEIATAVLSTAAPLIAERAAADERERWRTLLADHVDPDPCWFDHHGGCQAHGYLSLQPGEKCPSAQAKELLAETEAAIARRPETA